MLEDYSEKQLNNIIDCLDPDWVPVTDEYMIKENKIVDGLVDHLRLVEKVLIILFGGLILELQKP